MATPFVPFRPGTIAVTASSTAFVGTGTTFTAYDIGDYLIVRGLPMRIATITDATHGTFAIAYPGTTGTGLAYDWMPASDLTRAITYTLNIMQTLSNGNLLALAGLVSAADKLAYFTGAGTAGLADLKAGPRAALGLTAAAGKFIQFTGASSAVMQDILGTVAQSGGVPTGAIVERGTNANGEHMRFADGTQICVQSAGASLDTTTAVGSNFRTTAATTWTFPAAFVSTTGLTGGAIAQNASRWATFLVGNSSTGTYYQWGGATSATTVATRLFAIGRWF